MKSLALCLVLAAMPVIAGQPSVTPAHITVYTEFAQEPPPGVLSALQEEVESIMHPMSLEFDWRMLSSEASHETSVELAIVTFKGQCDAAGPLPPTGVAGALGWTHMSDGVILPFAGADCELLRAFLGKSLLRYEQPDRDEIFGRALGRVVAHELYHIFANTTRHGADGVGKAGYSVNDLISINFHFEAREAAALKTSKAHAEVENNPASEQQ